MTPEQLFKQMELDNQAVANLKLLYQKIEKDVIQGINLQSHYVEVNAAIYEMQVKINNLLQTGRRNEGFETIRRDLYYLVEEILKRM